MARMVRSIDSIDAATERERLRITLASIGDGMISTDAEGRVVDLNVVAQTLTGWSQVEAQGRPLPEVFRIINEVTRLPVENPAIRALAHGRSVKLANHTLLVAKDGTERPIDDSAAPMRDADGAIIGAVLIFRDVSERRRAEQLRAQLAAIVESSNDAIVSKSLDGTIRSWNSGAAHLFGYTSEEAVGQPIQIIIPPDKLDEELVILRSVAAGQRVEHFETVRIARDGRRLDISLTVSPIYNADGQVIGASKIGRDITAQRRQSAALRDSEARHRFLADLGSATQPLTDAAEVMATTTRMLAEHLGTDRCAYAEVEDASVFVITGDYTRGVASIVGRWPVAAFGAECMRSMLANQAYVVDDVDSDPQAGPDLDAYRQTDIQAVICIPLHKAGVFTAAMAVHQKTVRHWTSTDIELVRTVVARSWETIERTRAMRGLKDHAERLALALVAAKLGDWRWDAATDLLTLSPRAADIFGISGTTMTWASMRTLVLDEADRDRARQAVERALAEHGQYQIEYQVQRPDGNKVWISAQGRAQYDTDERPLGMIGVVQDITETRRLHEELRQHATELAEADRKKDEFIAMLAHELRNPLAPVRSGLEVMRLAADDRDTIAKTREMMDRQLSHMVRLIDDLLDVSRLSRNKLHLQKTRVGLAEVLSDAIEAASPAIADAKHRLHTSLPTEPVFIDGDRTRLSQVFGNLLINSAKYTPPGGQIWLSTERVGPRVVVSVRDSGVGIASASLPSVFEMFAQGDRSLERNTGGLGIGLAIVKGLVEMHGGVVKADSPGLGRGSTFMVELPVAAGKTDANVPAVDARPVAVKRTVLVADDNQDGAEALTMLLEILGHTVHVAHDGIEAVALAERVHPDIVFMDIGMPRLSGLDATRQIRQRDWGKSMTIIALTGWGQDADRQRSRDVGCDGHMVKPINADDLSNMLALERRG